MRIPEGPCPLIDGMRPGAHPGIDTYHRIGQEGVMGSGARINRFPGIGLKQDVPRDQTMTIDESRPEKGHQGKPVESGHNPWESDVRPPSLADLPQCKPCQQAHYGYSPERKYGLGEQSTLPSSCFSRENSKQIPISHGIKHVFKCPIKGQRRVEYPCTWHNTKRFLKRHKSGCHPCTYKRMTSGQP